MSISVYEAFARVGKILFSCSSASARKIFLITALTLLSWQSTFTGMLDLISSNRGALPERDMAAVGVAVASIQLMMLYILDALFSGRLRRWLKPMFMIGYTLLVLISVTFSFGFYWSLLESHHVSTTAAVASVGNVRQALEVGRSRLKQLEQTFSSLSASSTLKAEQERTRGGTCGSAAMGAAGPLQLREADAQRLSYAKELVSHRIQSVEADIATIDTEFAKLMAGGLATASATATGEKGTNHSQGGQHNAAILELDRELGLTVSRYNSLRTDPQLFAIKDELSKRAEQTTFSTPDKRRFICSDAPLGAALKGAVRAIGKLPSVSTQHLAVIEGEQATFEAFRRLQASAWIFIESLINATTDARSETRAIAPSDGLSSRDYLPLGISVFVDFCIFLIAMNRPWGQFHNLLGGSEADSKEELSEFLRVFYHAFVESHGAAPRVSALVRPLHDVVFSHNGYYFGVAPLSFHNQELKEGVRLSESRYVANVFVALEGRGLVKLVRPWRRWLSALSERRIAQKLKAQISPFAEVNAFRLYRFAPQAWQGIVLRSVLNAPDAPPMAQLEADTRLTPGQSTAVPPPCKTQSLKRQSDEALTKGGNNGPTPLQHCSAPEFGSCKPPRPSGRAQIRPVLQSLSKPPTQLGLPAPQPPQRTSHSGGKLARFYSDDVQHEQMTDDELCVDQQLIYDQSDSQEIVYLEEAEVTRAVNLQFRHGGDWD
jgi:hypothetical protein